MRRTPRTPPGYGPVPHDRPTLSISTLVTLRYILGSWWPSGQCTQKVVGSWAESTIFFSAVAFAVRGVDLCCVRVGWKSVPSSWYSINLVSLCIEQLIPSVFTRSCTGCMVPFPTQFNKSTSISLIMNPINLFYTRKFVICITHLHRDWRKPRGVTQIWFGQGCAARASKPIPIFKGDFAQKWYPFLRIFLQKKAYFSKIPRFSGNPENLSKCVESYICNN